MLAGVLQPGGTGNPHACPPVPTARGGRLTQPNGCYIIATDQLLSVEAIVAHRIASSGPS